MTRSGHAKFDARRRHAATRKTAAEDEHRRGGIDYRSGRLRRAGPGGGEPNRYVEDDVEAARVEQVKAEAALSKPVPPPANKNPVVDATKDGGFATRHGRICAVWSQTADDTYSSFKSVQVRGRTTSAALSNIKMMAVF